jgi:1,4-alpha-glucan branching enzyme
MWTHPGKKLLFMGGEFGQSAEWNHDRSLDWHLLQYKVHEGVQLLIRDLNRLYRETPALHVLDCEPEGFQWIDAANWEQSTLSYLRLGRGPGEFALVACNFTPVPRDDYRVGCPIGGIWYERINTDASEYGGSGSGNAGQVMAEAVPFHGQPCSLRLKLPPLGTLVLTPG